MRVPLRIDGSVAWPTLNSSGTFKPGLGLGVYDQYDVRFHLRRAKCAIWVLLKLTSCHLQMTCVEPVFRGLMLSPLSALSVTNWLSKAVVYVSKMVVLTSRTFKAC